MMHNPASHRPEEVGRVDQQTGLLGQFAGGRLREALTDVQTATRSHPPLRPRDTRVAIGSEQHTSFGTHDHPGRLTPAHAALRRRNRDHRATIWIVHGSKARREAAAA